MASKKGEERWTVQEARMIRHEGEKNNNWTGAQEEAGGDDFALCASSEGETVSKAASKDATGPRGREGEKCK